MTTTVNISVPHFAKGKAIEVKKQSGELIKLDENNNSVEFVLYDGETITSITEVDAPVENADESIDERAHASKGGSEARAEEEKAEEGDEQE